jgi:hypothetical protein
MIETPKNRRDVMSKLNFEQSLPRKRDLGGISSITVLAFALVLCLEWSLFIHMGS